MLYTVQCCYVICIRQRHNIALCKDTREGGRPGAGALHVDTEATFFSLFRFLRRSVFFCEFIMKTDIFPFVLLEIMFYTKSRFVFTLETIVLLQIMFDRKPTIQYKDKFTVCSGGFCRVVSYESGLTQAVCVRLHGQCGQQL